MPRRPRLLVGTALAALTALVAFGCSSEAEPEPLTAEQAAAVVAAGLLTEADLPSGDWTVIEGEAVDESEAFGPDTEAMFADTSECRDLELALAELTGGASEGEAQESTPLAEGQREFDFGGGDQLTMRSVQSSVTVPADPAEVEAGFTLLREVMTSERLRPCFESAFTEALSGGEGMGVSITSIEVTEPAKVTEDGVALAIDLAALAFIIPINLHLQMHFWPEGPAVGQLMFMELNSEALKDAASELREAARSRLAAAVEANK